MTSDAKIGLLLGLVFIFIIAFIINGLPGLHQKDDSNKLTSNMVGLQSSQPGLAATERKVQQVLEPTISQPSSPGYAQPAESAVGSTDTRFAMALPQNAPAATDTAQTTTDAPAVASAQSPSVDLATSVSPAVKTNPMVKPDSATGPKYYTIQDGDSLGSIAKKFYGEQEGNKVANVNAIFEANRKTLVSADVLYVGQKLVIPPLPASGTPSSSELSGPGFVKVGSIGKRHLPTTSDKSSPAAKSVSSDKSGSVYVVKEGDSLWKIAAERLGDGNRYKEIAKLNIGALTNEDDLTVGMQLKLPSR